MPGMKGTTFSMTLRQLAADIEAEICHTLPTYHLLLVTIRPDACGPFNRSPCSEGGRSSCVMLYIQLKVDTEVKIQLPCAQLLAQNRYSDQELYIGVRSFCRLVLVISSKLGPWTEVAWYSTVKALAIVNFMFSYLR